MDMAEVTHAIESVEFGESDFSHIRSYLLDSQLRRLSAGTIQSYESNLRVVTKFLHSIEVSILDLDKDNLRLVLEYLVNERGVNEKTLNNYFCAVSSFLDYLTYEDVVKSNPIQGFRKRYLKNYKKNAVSPQRKLITVEEASKLINSALSIRDKTLMAVLAKTGVRRGELISMDVDDIDWLEQRIKLKPKNKRSNLYVYFDEETAMLLRRWLSVRESYANSGIPALFVGDLGNRIGRNIVYNIVTEYAQRLGLHNSDSPRLEDHFSPHCFRHWFTTHLRRNGMNREFIKELRGDARGEAIDIYDHIDHEELRKAYLAAIPRLGII
jgi:integrase/recombinase XerD